MTWVKLEVGNDWGALFYTYPGERLDSSGTNATRNALELREGLDVAIRFPDGWGSVVALVPRVESFRYSDMGHEHTGQTTRWGFEADVHGLKVWVPIESVEVAQQVALRRWEAQEAQAKQKSEPAP